MRNLTDALATYPQVDSTLMSKIGAAGGAQVSMVLTGYDAATGALQFDAQSGSVIDIPSYVLKLQKTGLDEIHAENDDYRQTCHQPVQPVNYVYIGTATISAQCAVTQWLDFLDEVEHRYKGLRVTNFSIADYDYVANNTQGPPDSRSADALPQRQSS